MHHGTGKTTGLENRGRRSQTHEHRTSNRRKSNSLCRDPAVDKCLGCGLLEEERTQQLLTSWRIDVYFLRFAGTNCNLGSHKGKAGGLLSWRPVGAER